MTTLKEFGKLLKAAINKKGFTLNAAAKAAGVPMNSISHWTCGYCVPSEQSFQDLVKACGGFEKEIMQMYAEIKNEPRKRALKVKRVAESPATDKEKFCALLTKARLSAGIAQADLAVAADVTHSYGNKWETGRTVPSTRVWEKIKQTIPIPEELDEVYSRICRARIVPGQRPSWIRDERAALGWTQHQLAKAINVSEQMISNFETGKIDPSDMYIKKIRAAFKEARTAEPKVQATVTKPKQEEPMVGKMVQTTNDLEKLMATPKQWMDKVAETAELLDPSVRSDVKDTLRGIAQMVKHLAMVLKSVPASSLKTEGPKPKIKVEPKTEIKVAPVVEPKVEPEPKRVVSELIRPYRGISALTLDPDSPLFPFRAEVPSIPFGTRLDEVRRESRLSEPELAILVGMPAWDFWRIENLKKVPSRSEAEAICRAIGKPFDMMCPQLSDQILTTRQLVDEIFNFGISADEIAETCGIPEEIVHQWEEHIRFPRFCDLEKMAGPFGLNINALMNLMIRMKSIG